MPKRIIAANDLVGLGKVALTSMLPILAACGIEVSPLPTVILSSHTGGFDHLYAEEFTKGMSASLFQWEQLKIPFNGVVTGYLKNINQAKLLGNYAKKHSLPLVVDPIMGDDGKLYSGFNADHVKVLKELCQSAELILPNLTEAAFLTETEFLAEEYSQEQVEELLHRLADLGAKHVILTGISFSSEKIGVAYLNAKTNTINYAMSLRYPEHFFGTGDLLTAIVTAVYFQGISLADGIPLALSFLDRTMETTRKNQSDLRLGLLYEEHLGYLFSAFRTLLEDKK
ncbi:pyridoxamine kinase [Streptococcus dentiloxodontae]